MAGPQEFMVGNAPAPASYASGLMDFSAVGKLGDQYLKGRAANAFADLPMKNGQIDQQEVLKRALQTGAVPVEALLPYLGGTGYGAALSNAIGGGQPAGGAGGESRAGGPPSQRVPTAEAANDAAYIRQAATARGIDPNVAVRVAASEGLFDYTGDEGSSFGPFQLHYGGMASGGNAVGGLGDEFTKATGLHASDPRTKKAQIDFALDHAAQNGWGPWHGWKGAQFAGIGAQSRALGQSKAAAADLSPQNQAPVAANASDQAGSRAAIMGNAERAKGASKLDTAGNEIVDKSGGVSPARQQVSTGPNAEPGTAAPQTAGAGGRPIPTTGTGPAQPEQARAAAPQVAAGPAPSQPAPQVAPAERKPLPLLPDPVPNDRLIQDWKQQQRNIQQSVIGSEFTKAGPALEAKARLSVENLQKAIDGRSDLLRKPLEKTNEARAQGYWTTEQMLAGQEGLKAKIARDTKLGELQDKRFADLSSTIQSSANSEPARKQIAMTKVAKNLFNNPDTVTGLAENKVYTYDQLQGYIRGRDPHSAAALDAVSKVAAQQMLEQMVNLRTDITQETGEKTGKIFAPMVTAMQDASANAHNTLEGNRFLVEMQSRFHQLNQDVAKEEAKYRKVHGALDQGWYEYIGNYLDKRTEELFTSRELAAGTRLLGAVEMPKEYDSDPKAAQNWAQTMRLEPNQPVRVSGSTTYHPAQWYLSGGKK